MPSRSSRPHRYWILILIISSCGSEAGETFHHPGAPAPWLEGYRPTRQFAIVMDEDGDQRLVAVDDGNARFNQLWLEQQTEDGYGKQGSSALSELFRRSFKAIYRNYRALHAEQFRTLPDEEGRGQLDHTPLAPTGVEIDYRLHIDDDELRLKLEMTF